MSFDLSDTYIREMSQRRQEKDAFFRTSPHSPFPHQQRRRFSGLRYYPPNPAYRVSAKVEHLPDQQLVEMTTSDGQQQRFIRFAFLHFMLDGTLQRLTAYRSLHEHGETALFIPFRDALSGKETYGAGRYLDIPFHEENATLILDFNEAYNPYCAYSDSYSCPVPPAENTLSCTIQAGERLYHN